MAIGVLQEFEATMDEYKAVNEKLGDDQPEGGLVHTASDIGDGKMRVFDVWESQAAFDKFMEEKLGPAIAEVAPDSPPPLKLEVHELHDLVIQK